ncbi:MAG: glycosyltransferase family 2 protein [Pyrinomonadaceae bacterium]
MFELTALNWLVGVAWVTVLLWFAAAFATLRGIRRQPPLAPVMNGDGESLRTNDAPMVSILVPARNEEDRVLAAAVSSMLAQDYGNFEIVAVNDRSTDKTGEMLYAIAKKDERLRVIDGAPLPEGWLGKPHAMQQALRAARGEWMLATDADMIFEPRAVRTAVARALAGEFDAVTFIPHVRCLSFWERVFMPVFGWFMVVALPVHRVNDPKRREAIGIGGFFMIHRGMLRRVGEYNTVRAEVAEDLRMAEALKRAGARLRVEYAPDLCSTRMQTNFREIWEGFTKNLFAGAEFSVLKSIAGSIGVLLFAVAPLLVALTCAFIGATRDAPQPGAGWLKLLVPAALIWIIQVSIFALVNNRCDVPVRYALTVPLGHALFIAILANSTIRIATGNGVTWKGRQLYERAGVRPPRARRMTPNLPVADE